VALEKFVCGAILTIFESRWLGSSIVFDELKVSACLLECQMCCLMIGAVGRDGVVPMQSTW
jgi:hypothetical protein